MKINVDLNAKSIQNAINALKTAEKQLGGEMLNEFLIKACEWIKTQANEQYLSLSTIGTRVKEDIKNSWVIEQPSNGTIKMTNTADKAVYVEFGVGVVGAQNKHKNANKTGYEYNMASPYKLADGTWVFTTNADLDDLDLPKDTYDQHTSPDDGMIAIETKGAEGVMYAYNAIVDFRNYGAKEVWQKIKVKYWG